MTDGRRFDRLPATDGDRRDATVPTRDEVLAFWAERFGVDPATFDGHTFWVKGEGSVWAVAGDEPSPVEVQALGLRALRTGGHDWKPTTNAAQRFGDAITRNVVALDREAARRFVRGEDQAVGWDGDDGYLVASTEVAGEPVVLGVGLYVRGRLRSQVPKARRVALPR